MQRKDRSIRVSVSDRGIGIPVEELESIFDRFIQSSKTRTGAGGTGLGLAISREIISAHKGRIWAGNRPDGGGAVLSFEIPYNLNQEPDEESDEEPNQEDLQDAGLVTCGLEIEQAIIANTPTCS